MSTRTGHTIGNYTLAELLGRGTFGSASRKCCTCRPIKKSHSSMIVRMPSLIIFLNTYATASHESYYRKAFLPAQDILR